MSPADVLDFLKAYDLLLVVAGRCSLAVAVLPRMLHDKPLSVPILMAALDYVLICEFRVHRGAGRKRRMGFSALAGVPN